MFVTDKCKLEFLARYAFQTVRTCKYFVGWDDTSPPLPSPLLYSQYCTILYCQCQGFGHWCTCPTFVSNLYSQWLSDALKTTNKTLSLSRSLDKTFHSTICLMFFWKIRETLGWKWTQFLLQMWTPAEERFRPSRPICQRARFLLQTFQNFQARSLVGSFYNWFFLGSPQKTRHHAPLLGSNFNIFSSNYR